MLKGLIFLSFLLGMTHIAYLIQRNSVSLRKVVQESRSSQVALDTASGFLYTLLQDSSMECKPTNPDSCPYIAPEPYGCQLSNLKFIRTHNSWTRIDQSPFIKQGFINRLAINANQYRGPSYTDWHFYLENINYNREIINAAPPAFVTTIDNHRFHQVAAGFFTSADNYPTSDKFDLVATIEGIDCSSDDYPLAYNIHLGLSVGGQLIAHRKIRMFIPVPEPRCSIIPDSSLYVQSTTSQIPVSVVVQSVWDRISDLNGNVVMTRPYPDARVLAMDTVWEGYMPINWDATKCSPIYYLKFGTANNAQKSWSCQSYVIITDANEKMSAAGCPNVPSTNTYNSTNPAPTCPDPYYTTENGVNYKYVYSYEDGKCVSAKTKLLTP
ncbi:MAG: hypothetical protein R3B45_12715 [Bdellovibrionota bacterium]